MTGEDRARLDTQNVRQLGVWTEPQQRKSTIAALCWSVGLLIVVMGMVVVGLK